MISDSTKRIIYIHEDNTLAVLIPSSEYLETHSIEELAQKDVPQGCEYHIINVLELPTDTYFMPAWRWESGIKIDLNKAKEISHNIRREKRTMEFEPLDNLIAKKIPGTNETQIEAQRQEIRDRYAQIQTQIDQAQSPEELKSLPIFDIT